ncbi:HD domain-containing protein [Dehalobacter sp. DCM]|uniref:HD domain-containing protein n=1 Tax=Dehalobacter sp. DCM TaxID=2907827 RepID=UPI003081CFF9|nr:HD domain-containing protein [Dehalobacter sp. DCM]
MSDYPGGNKWGGSEHEMRAEDFLCKEHQDCLAKIRKRVEKMWNAPNEKPLPFYTTHGPEHCRAVESLIMKLIPRFAELKEEERFYLLASAWLHDIGMLRSVANEFNTDKDQIELTDSEIRDRHHLTSEKYIYEYYDRCGLEHKLNNTNHTEDKEIIGKICRYHRKREDINECARTLPIRYEAYHVQLLAAFLRLADALHIDSSRAPDYGYAICLAYDIPSELKMHWIKSKLVLGVIIDEEKHRITVSFRIPTLEQLKERNVDDPTWVLEKIEFIIKDVMNDLHTELASVMHILAKGGLAYYLDIQAERVTDYIERQLLNDLLSMVINYNILRNPSASNLIEMVLMSIANMSGYYLKEHTKATQVSKIPKEEIKSELKKFVAQIRQNLLEKRPCHIGLKHLIDRCELLCDQNLPANLSTFITEINTLYQLHFQRKSEIRESARLFFWDFVLPKERDVSQFKYNILLFGYSNLVVQALCGFRDCLITQQFSKDTQRKRYNIYSTELKKEISEQFRIFVCDGQPKTQLNLNNGVLFHDGFSLAYELIKMDFTDVILIPDIIAGNVMEHYEIDFIMMGANGFTKDQFKHSAGHHSIIKLKEHVNNKVSPEVVLVVTSDKFEKSGCSHQENDDPKQIKDESHPDMRIYGDHPDTFRDRQPAETSGYRFLRPENISTRDHIWFQTFDEMRKVNDSLLFYNPREDSIGIGSVDYVISDLGCYCSEEKTVQTRFESINTFTRRLMSMDE